MLTSGGGSKGHRICNSCLNVLQTAQNSFLYNVILLDSVILMSTSSSLHSSLSVQYSILIVHGSRHCPNSVLVINQDFTVN